jgi:hypothetical protein
MSRIRPILPMPFARDVDGVALGTRPLLGVTLPVGFMNFFLINDDNMVRNAMCLIG